MSLMPSSRSPSFSTSSVLARTSVGPSDTGTSPGISSGCLSIDALLERLDADPAPGVDEAFAVLTSIEIGGNQGVDRLDDLVGGEDADMADMVVAAGVDAARDLDLEVAYLVLAGQIGEVIGNALRHRNRARVG